MTWFQVCQFIKVSYFVQLMVVSTLTVIVTQALAFRAWGGDPYIMWVRGGIIGVWTVSTCAAGILGFERYKGTLVYMVSGRIDPRLPMAAVVSAASTFGLAAIPLAWVSWAVFTGTNGLNRAFTLMLLARLVGGTLLLWIACLSVAFVIATIFVLTPNAISYESLLVAPILIASGIMFTSAAPPSWLKPISVVIPLHWAALILLDQVHGFQVWLSGAFGLGISLVWMLIAWRLGRMVLDRVSRTATLEVI
ncbi:MAG: ABC transporter permease [Bifidobacterium sp.]|nr:ABC transporter permease [Bifidobacterium sp.]